LLAAALARPWNGEAANRVQFLLGRLRCGRAREPAMMGGRDWNEWIAQYETSHRDPRNRICHTFGIPMIVVALALFVMSPFVAGLWIWATILFVLGWALQFVGHIYERKPPEFFSDWRFLFVGLRWWLAKMSGRV
jgi:uncharacterized membrane protein YGL010W